MRKSQTHTQKVVMTILAIGGLNEAGVCTCLKGYCMSYQVPPHSLPRLNIAQDPVRQA